MRLDRLFHVLVVMSAPPAVLACGNGDDGTDQRRDGDGDDVDAAVDPGGNGTTDAAATGSGSGSDMAQPCFCDVQSCCDRSTSTATVLDGFECCWSTTCP